MFAFDEDFVAVDVAVAVVFVVAVVVVVLGMDEKPMCKLKDAFWNFCFVFKDK